MQQGIRQILYMGVCMGILSVLYFLSLTVNLPFIATITLAVAACFFCYRWLFRNPAEEATYLRGFPLLILITGITIMTMDATEMAFKYGQWDAWAMWNLHAKYLSEPKLWQDVFLNTQFNHPDYPMLLPANVAFFSRLFTGGYSGVVAFAFSFLASVSIVALLYCEMYKRSIFFATIFLLFFIYNDYFLAQGVAQYADTWIGFFLVAAVIALQHSAADKRMIWIAAFLLGCCIWTKNEGIVLAGLTLAFYLRRFFAKRHILYTLTGFALPVAAYLVLKLMYAPNMDDRLTGQGADTLQFLTQPDRYKMVYDYFSQNLDKHFYWAKIFFTGTLIIMLLSRQKPNRVLLLVFACMIAYTLVYVMLPQDLEWHLQTSQDRLMHQLLPLFIYALYIQLTGKRLIVIRRIRQQ